MNVMNWKVLQLKKERIKLFVVNLKPFNITRVSEKWWQLDNYLVFTQNVLSLSIKIIHGLKHYNKILTEVAGEGGPDLAPQKFLLSQQFRHLMKIQNSKRHFHIPSIFTFMNCKELNKILVIGNIKKLDQWPFLDLWRPFWISPKNVNKQLYLRN